MFIFKLQRVYGYEEDQSLLRAYIGEWSTFFTQCLHLPRPFFQLETALQHVKTLICGTKNPQQSTNDSLIRKVKFISSYISKLDAYLIFLFSSCWILGI